MTTIFGRTAENWYLEQLKQDTAVKFKLADNLTGEGLVKGISGNGTPVLGKTYIIEVTKWDVEDSYKTEYSHISVPEIFLEVC